MAIECDHELKAAMKDKTALEEKGELEAAWVKDQQITKMQAQLMEVTTTYKQFIEKINRIEEVLGNSHH